MHILERSFVEPPGRGTLKLPFHRAIKKVPFVDSNGDIHKPDAPNAVKFERFIFDALPLAEPIRRWSRPTGPSSSSP